MSKPTLTYFDAPVSRGEECRLALHLAGVDFVDHRIKHADWQTLKPSTPFGSLPTLEWPGKGTFAQSNALLVLIGCQHGLHPSDPFEAARHLAVMEHVEDLRIRLGLTIRLADDAQKKAAREDLAASYLPLWGESIEKQLGAGPFFAGEGISVVDLKLFVVTRWLRGGAIDHLPTTVLDPFTKLSGIHDAVRDDARVRAWQAQST